MHRTCKRCNCPIIFAENPQTGATIPLDASSPVYRLVDDRDHDKLLAFPVKNFHVSHFKTCRHADEFSRKKEKKT